MRPGKPLRRDTEKARAFAEKRSELKPGKPLSRGAPLETRSELKSTIWSTPQAEKRRRAREKKRREEQFAEASGYYRWVLEQPCAACGTYDSEVGSQPAHVGKTRGAGAKADRVLSLCPPCHLDEHANRRAFNAAFRVRHGVTPEEMAMYRYELYHRELAA